MPLPPRAPDDGTPPSLASAMDVPGDASGGDVAVQPALRAAADALARAAVPWALLRGRDGAGEDEVDLIVPARRRDAFARAVADAGFAPWPAIGHGRHRFFRTYDRAADRWLTLDVVDELAFGAGGALRLPVDVDALVGRRTDDVIPGLAADDAYWALLLHDLLDRRDLPDHHRARLAAVRSGVRADGPLGTAIDRAGGAGLSAALLGAMDAGDEPAARRRARAMTARIRRADFVTFARRRVGAALGARLRKPHAALARRGLDVAILGPDGAGKSTLARRLVETLPIPTRTIYLGLYGAGRTTPPGLGLPVRMWWLWKGWLGGAWHRLRGRVVVYDRHALDAAGSPARSTRRRIRRWLLVHAIPAPSLVIVLDAPGGALHDRKGEHDPEALDAMRAAYRRIADGRRNAVVLDATAEPDAVRRNATAAIWDRWSRRRRR
jgi:hypothetical protein